jgi:hypothetical protein
MTLDALAAFHFEPGLALFFKPIGRLFLATWGKARLDPSALVCGNSGNSKRRCTGTSFWEFRV